MSSERRLFRARNGAVLGVCLGFARWRDMPVMPVRFLFIAMTIFTGIFPGLALYIVAALFMEPEPLGSLRQDREDDFYFYERLRRTGASAMNDIQEKFRRFRREPENCQTDEDSFYHRYRSSRANAMNELQEKMSRLDAKLQRMEDKVTKKQFDWDERMNREP